MARIQGNTGVANLDYWFCKRKITALHRQNKIVVNGNEKIEERSSNRQRPEKNILLE